MKYYSNGFRLFFVLVVLVLGIAVGAVKFGPTFAESYLENSPGKKINYPKNKNGETYGSSLYANSPDEEPALVKAYGVDGTIGYVRSKDLYGDLPKTPEEALEKQRLNAGKSRQIPLYDIDGETVIGVYEISGATGKSTK